MCDDDDCDCDGCDGCDEGCNCDVCGVCCAWVCCAAVVESTQDVDLTSTPQQQRRQQQDGAAMSAPPLEEPVDTKNVILTQPTAQPPSYGDVVGAKG